MKYIENNKFRENKIDCIKNIIIRILYFIIFLLIFSALICISCAEELFSDYDTVLYWVDELLSAAGQIFVIGAVTTMCINLIAIKEKSTS